MSSRIPLLSSHWLWLNISSYCREFYGEVIVSGEVHDEVVVAGAGLPGDEELRRSSWIRVESAPSESMPEVVAACVGLGEGERSIIYLASALNANLVLIDEERARRAAKRLGLNVAGSIAILERSARLTYGCGAWANLHKGLSPT